MNYQLLLPRRYSNQLFFAFLWFALSISYTHAQTAIPTINTQSWMGDIHEAIKHVKLKELKILGTHGALYERNGGANFCDQQGESIATQFLKGARYFDTRIGHDNGQFYSFHGDLCSDQDNVDIDLNELRALLDSNPQEIIIMEIHQARGDYQAIADMLYEIFGDILISPTLSIHLTVEEALNSGQVLLLFSTNPTADNNAFWPGASITSDWVGTDDNEELRDWLVGEINNLHYGDFPTDQFWVRQCARSYVLFTTESLMSMAEGSNRRFEEAWIDENLWMSKCWNIIKFDWFGYYNHMQKVVERIARWYYCTHMLQSEIALPKGYYKIRAKYSGLVLDVAEANTNNGANIQQWHDIGTPNQQWLFEHIGQGKYLISARHSGKIMEVPGDYMNNTANVQQGEMRPYSNAYWLLEEAEPGYYYIRSLASGRCVDVSGVSAEAGANIWLYDVMGNDNQKFSIELVAPVSDAPFFGDGTFAIKAKHSGKLLEVLNADAANGATLVQEDCDDATQQRWQLHYFGASQYLLEATHSGKLIDGTTNYGNLYQWKNNKSLAQHFLISDLSNGYFSIKSQLTNQYVSVQNAGIQNGDQVVFEDWTGGEHQQWEIINVTTVSCACVNNLSLNGAIETGTYQVANTIDATGNISESVLFSAGTAVNLLPGFCVDSLQNNATFEIKMEGCATPP